MEGCGEAGVPAIRTGGPIVSNSGGDEMDAFDPCLEILVRPVPDSEGRP
jgi:hypothetical protein